MFLLVHIGFVGVHSGNVNMGGFFGTNGGFLVHLGGGYIWGVFWYLPGGFLLQNGGGFGRHHSTLPPPLRPFARFRILCHHSCPLQVPIWLF